MKIKYFSTACLFCLFCSVTVAQVYQVQNERTGHVTLTNIPPKHQRSPIESSPDIKPQQAPAQVPKSQETHKEFPKITVAQQAVRDNDRRKILQDELADEERQLLAAQKRGDKDIIHRITQNVEALKRELSK